MNDEDSGREPDKMPIEAAGLAAKAGPRLAEAAIRRASEATGAAFDVLYAMARRESAFNPQAKAATSSAAGLFQFIEQTWLGAVKAYGPKHGLGEAAAAVVTAPNGKFAVADPETRAAILNLRFDPDKAAALAGELVQENAAGLEKALGRAANAAEIYAAHFLGLAGAVKLLTAGADAAAATLLPRAAAANRGVFYDGERAKSVGEVLAGIAKSMGLGSPSAATAPATRPAAGLETKSAFGFRAPERLEPGWRGPAMARAASRLAELFGLRSVALPRPAPSASLIALQALDPTDIGERRSGRRAG